MVASTTESTSEDAEFLTQAVGQQSYVNHHSVQMFEEGRSFSGNERFKFFFGRGDGAFADVSALTGADTNLDGRAVLATDFDDDGDQDLFVHNLQRERHLLYRNDLGDPEKPRFVKVRLVGTSGQWEAIGATVVLESGGKRVAQVLSRGAGFVSCQAPELVFGLGGEDGGRVSVQWPGGLREDFGEVDAQRARAARRGQGRARALRGPHPPAPGPVPGGTLPAHGRDPGRARARRPRRELAATRPQRAGGRQALLVNLWASTCAPCVAELPRLAELDGEGERRVVLVSLDLPEDRERAARIAEERAPGLSTFYLRDDGSGIDDIVDKVRLPIPTSLELSPQGELSSVIRGVIE